MRSPCLRAPSMKVRMPGWMRIRRAAAPPISRIISPMSRPSTSAMKSSMRSADAMGYQSVGSGFTSSRPRSDGSSLISS